MFLAPSSSSRFITLSQQRSFPALLLSFSRLSSTIATTTPHRQRGMATTVEPTTKKLRMIILGAPVRPPLPPPSLSRREDASPPTARDAEADSL